MQKGEIVLFLKSGLKTQKKNQKATGTALEDIETGKFSNDKLVYQVTLKKKKVLLIRDSIFPALTTDQRFFSGKI